MVQAIRAQPAWEEANAAAQPFEQYLRPLFAFWHMVGIENTSDLRAGVLPGEADALFEVVDIVSDACSLHAQTKLMTVCRVILTI